MNELSIFKEEDWIREDDRSRFPECLPIGTTFQEFVEKVVPAILESGIRRDEDDLIVDGESPWDDKDYEGSYSKLKMPPLFGLLQIYKEALQRYVENQDEDDLKEPDSAWCVKMLEQLEHEYVVMKHSVREHTLESDRYIGIRNVVEFVGKTYPFEKVVEIKDPDVKTSMENLKKTCQEFETTRWETAGDSVEYIIETMPIEEISENKDLKDWINELNEESVKCTGGLWRPQFGAMRRGVSSEPFIQMT